MSDDELNNSDLRLVSLEDAAKFLSVHVRTVRRMMEKKELRKLKVMGRTCVAVGDLKNYVNLQLKRSAS